MLHILFLILKTAGIILAAILGILVLLICCVLFHPIRYEISGRCEETLDTLKIKATATWFLHLLRVDVYYKDGVTKWRTRAAWVKRVRGQSERGKSSSDETSKEQSGEEKTRNGKPEGQPDGGARGKKEKKRKAGNEKHEYKQEKIQNTLEERKEVPEPDKKNQEDPEIDQEECEKKGIFDKVRELCRKKERLRDFLTDEIHILAFKILKKEAFRFLRKLKPKIIKADICFGFEDPCTTGQVLAGLAIVYPVIAEQVSITPDFERQILKGSVYVKGNVRLSIVASLLWNLFRSRNVRATYRDYKNFKL